MANLVDTSVNGDLRVTGTMFGTQAGNYATCATAAATAAKAVTISGFTLTTGIHVFVKFTVTNTAAVASLTLNVSGTGAKAMKYRGGNLPAVGTLSASRVYEFIYDGTNWELVGDLDTNTQTVTGVKGNAESSYRTGQVNITPANIGISATTTSVTVGDTTASIPQATTTTPKMDGTAAVGSETKWAKGDHVHPTDTSRAPTSHASSATTYGVGTTANYGHVKLDNSTPLTVGTASADGVATGKAHIHNAIESVPRTSVTTADLAHINTNSCAHMIFSQISASTSTTHDPGDGYMLSFMWDNTGKYDAQLFIPDGGTSATDFGRLKIRYCNNSAWGDWGYLPLATQSSLLTSADDLNNIKAYHAGEIIGCNWSTGNVPANAPLSSATSQMLVFRTHSGNYLNQLVIVAGGQMYVRNCNNNTWGAWEKMLVSSDITTGSANGTISVAGSDVAVKGLGGAAYLNTGTASGTVATGNHTHTTSIASDSSSGTVVTLAHNTQYKLTAGGTSVLFKTPADSNTDTKVKATAKTDNVNYKVLATASASPTSGNATEAIYDTDISLNPSTNTITSNISGNAATSTKPLSTLLTSSDDLNNVKADSHGDVRTYHWSSGNVPTNSVNTTSTGMMQVFRTHSNQYCVQMAYICDLGLYKRILVNGTWGAWSKILAQADVIDTYSSTGTAPVSGKAVASAISGKSPTTHTHSVKINGSEKTIAATGGTAVNLGTYTEFAHVSDTAVIGNNSPAADCKTYFTNNVSNGSCKVVYCKNGDEYTIIFSKQAGGAYGNIIKYGYASKYIYILRYKNSAWLSDDWEKIVAGHADSADSATSASSASKVANKLTLKIKTGTTEGTDLYTYDGSGAKTLDIKQGSNITLTAAAGSLTIAGTPDTKNTAGSTDTSSKIFLIGATSQAANPQTYSQDTTYVDTDATLASTKVRVAEKCTLQFNTTTNALDFVFA